MIYFRVIFCKQVSIFGVSVWFFLPQFSVSNFSFSAFLSELFLPQLSANNFQISVFLSEFF